MATVSKLDKAKASIVLDHPFFASILLRRPLKERTDIPTLAIDKRGNIYYNKQFVESLSVSEIVFALCHECMHYMGQHAPRMQTRTHKRWNHATDKWINDTLQAASIGQQIAGTLSRSGAKDMTCEALYDEEPEDQGGGDGSGRPDPNGQGQGLGDDILDEGGTVTESEEREMAAHARIEIAEAAQAAKMRGKLPGALAEFAADILESTTPWFDILERHMNALAAKKQSWLRPNRRFIPSGVYLPSRAKTVTMGELGLLVDVSGSISKEELAYYNGHIDRIIKQCNPAKVHVWYVDTAVQKEMEFEMGDDVRLEFYSGGGTDLEVCWDRVSELGLDLSCMVVLTDGYTSFTAAPEFPVVWCISSDVEAPYGEVVHFDMSH